MIIYAVCMLFIMLFSLVQLHLALVYKRHQKAGMSTPISAQALHTFPMVTIQLPVYNEMYVVERLLDAVIAIDWPRPKLEIQILDDSTDQTTSLIEKKISEEKFRGFEIYHIRRKNRKGYKAGALQFGLAVAQGEFIAIFDADFVPARPFLKDTVAAFTSASVGMVQTKWQHLNKDYSLLTRLQDFALNAHFTVEQTGRSAAGSYINFNGTAGIWRKACIVDAGGWQADTLTEDLDLSYRAQMKGWKFEYLENIKSPAELPVIMSAIKSQQFRWTKGGAETARKNLGKVLKSKMAFCNKAHAFFHLTNSANFLMLLIASVVSIPLLYIKYKNPDFRMYFNLGTVFIIGFAAIAYFYWIAHHAGESKKRFFVYFPMFMVFSMGFTFNNSLAVIEGLLGKKTSFVRTPKFNIVGLQGDWKGNIYLSRHLSWSTVLEGALSIYFLSGIVIAVLVADYGLILFHLMLSLGYGLIFYYSIKKQ